VGYEGGYRREDEAGMGVGSISGGSCGLSLRVAGCASQVGREERDGLWGFVFGILGFVVVADGGVAGGGVMGERGRVIWGKGVWCVGCG
jgi:hypothetical protein